MYMILKHISSLKWIVLGEGGGWVFITIHIWCVIRNGSGLVDHLSKRPQALFPIEEMHYRKTFIFCIHLSFAIFMIRKEYMIAKFSVLVFFPFQGFFLFFCGFFSVFCLQWFLPICEKYMVAKILVDHSRTIDVCEKYKFYSII